MTGLRLGTWVIDVERDAAVAAALLAQVRQAEAADRHVDLVLLGTGLHACMHAYVRPAGRSVGKTYLSIK